jgi:hypothetical protein
MHPKDWPWTSWSYYAKGHEGFIRIDPFDAGETAWTEQKTATEKSKSRTPPLKPKGAAPKTVSSR